MDLPIQPVGGKAIVVLTLRGIPPGLIDHAIKNLNGVTLSVVFLRRLTVAPPTLS